MTTKKIPEGYITWEELRTKAEAGYTDEQRREYEEAGPAVEAQIMLKELIYNMRTKAGLTQTELAERMGTSQPFVSDLERGGAGRTPSLVTLNRVAQATGNRIRLIAEPVAA